MTYWSPTAWYNWLSSKEAPTSAEAPPSGKVPELIRYKHLITPAVQADLDKISNE